MCGDCDAEGLTRCSWPGADPLYVAYHDTEWGVPVFDSRALWEKLVLDGFQAGLSWITILRKRDALRRAFQGFDPEIVAHFGEADIERLMTDETIIRSKAKINNAIKSARLTLDLADKEQNFSDIVWAAQGYRPIDNHYARREDVPAQNTASEDLSKRLKALGYGFCGPVIVYAFMQAVGMVNDHLTGCYRHGQITQANKA